MNARDLKFTTDLIKLGVFCLVSVIVTGGLAMIMGRLGATDKVEYHAMFSSASQLEKGKAIRANVEFYTAVLLEAAGIPRDAFSPTFAVSRIAGWCAHVDEQRRRGRLMRPLSKYVGPHVAA